MTSRFRGIEAYERDRFDSTVPSNSPAQDRQARRAELGANDVEIDSFDYDLQALADGRRGISSPPRPHLLADREKSTQ